MECVLYGSLFHFLLWVFESGRCWMSCLRAEQGVMASRSVLADGEESKSLVKSYFCLYRNLIMRTRLSS